MTPSTLERYFNYHLLISHVSVRIHFKNSKFYQKICIWEISTPNLETNERDLGSPQSTKRPMLWLHVVFIIPFTEVY